MPLEKNQEQMMNRRAFLKLFIGTVAVATLPIPRFLLKEERDTAWQGVPYDAASGSLTMEMIENASKAALANYGQPDRLYFSKPTYKKWAKLIGYRVEYVGDEIEHYKL